MIWSLIKKFAPIDLAFLIEGETRIGKRGDSVYSIDRQLFVACLTFNSKWCED